MVFGYYIVLTYPLESIYSLVSIRALGAAAGRETQVLLEVEGVTKRYRRSSTAANDGVTLAVETGEVYGLLGHNGAGKTTLVNQIVGLLKPDRGAIRIARRARRSRRSAASAAGPRRSSVPARAG